MRPNAASILHQIHKYHEKCKFHTTTYKWKSEYMRQKVEIGERGKIQSKKKSQW